MINVTNLNIPPYFPSFTENFEAGNFAQWYTLTGSPDTQLYGNGGYPSLAVSAAIGGGVRFARGGAVALSSVVKDIDISTYTTQIQSGQLVVKTSAFLGGFTTDADNAQIITKQLGANNMLITSFTIGPVTAADRANATTLLFREGQQYVDRNTKRIQLQLIFTRTGGTSNDGYVDNINTVFFML